MKNNHYYRITNNASNIISIFLMKFLILLALKTTKYLLTYQKNSSKSSKIINNSQMPLTKVRSVILTLKRRFRKRRSSKKWLRVARDYNVKNVTNYIHLHYLEHTLCSVRNNSRH